MNRRTWVGIGVVLVLAIGVGFVQFSLNDQDKTQYLTVNQVNRTPPDSHTIAFTDLTAAQQRVFNKSRNQEGLVRIPADVDAAVWKDNEYVTFDNQVYEVVVAVPD